MNKIKFSASLKIFSAVFLIAFFNILISCSYEYNATIEDLYGKWKSETVKSLNGTENAYFVLEFNKSGFSLEIWKENDVYTEDSKILSANFEANYEIDEGYIIANIQSGSLDLSYSTEYGNSGTISINQKVKLRFELTEDENLLWQGFKFSEYKEKVLETKTSDSESQENSSSEWFFLQIKKLSLAKKQQSNL